MPASPPLDLDRLQSYCGDSAAGALDALVQSFIESTNRLCEDLEQSIRRGDVLNLSRQAHNLAGAARFAGAERLAQAAQVLETMALSPPAELVMLRALVDEIQALRSEIVDFKY